MLSITDAVHSNHLLLLGEMKCISLWTKTSPVLNNVSFLLYSILSGERCLLSHLLLPPFLEKIKQKRKVNIGHVVVKSIYKCFLLPSRVGWSARFTRNILSVESGTGQNSSMCHRCTSLRVTSDDVSVMVYG